MLDYGGLLPAKESPVSGLGQASSLLRVPSDSGILQPFSCSRTMAEFGGRQLTLAACGLKKFAETANGRQVQLQIPKYVQGPVGLPCRYADQGCPFRSHRGTALASHERSCKKQPAPVAAAAMGAPLSAAPVAAPPIVANPSDGQDVEMEKEEEQECPASDCIPASHTPGSCRKAPKRNTRTTNSLYFWHPTLTDPNVRGTP